MDGNDTPRSSFETILKWVVVGILAIVALKIVFAVLATAFFVGGFLLWKVLPLVLIAWIVMRLVRGWRGGGGHTDPAADF